MNKFYSQIHLTINKEKNWFFIKDAIHGEIIFYKEHQWLYEMINTPEFQRLSYIKQLSMSYKNFPCSNHSRLTHSLGTYELMRRFIEHFKTHNYLNDSNSIEINIALAAALLHDLGHGPYSHLFEVTFDFSHEEMLIKILQSKESTINSLLKNKALSDNLNKNFYINEICKIFTKNSAYKWIEDLLSSKIDVDRLDYLKRDSYFSGVKYCNTDIDFLIKLSFLLEKEDKIPKTKRLVFSLKAKNHIFNFLENRKYMYFDLYNNKNCQIYEYLFTCIFKLFKDHFDELNINNQYDYLKFLKTNFKTWSIGDFLILNDKFMDQLILDLSKCNNQLITALCNLFLGYLEESNYQILLSKKPILMDDNPTVLFPKEINQDKWRLKNLKVVFFNPENKKLVNEYIYENSKLNKSFYIALCIRKNKSSEWIKYL